TKTQEISTYNEILETILTAMKEKDMEIQELSSINPYFEAEVILTLSQQEDIPFIENNEPINLTIKPNKTELSLNEELILNLSSDNPNLALMNISLEYDKHKLNLINEKDQFFLGTSGKTLIFKAISEDPESTIKIIPIQARNMANKEMQAQEVSITLTSQSPQISELLNSYPNPANQGCYIPFKLAKDSNVSFEIYNILGQKVRTINLGQRKAGSYTQKDRAIFFDLKNDSGQNLSSGLYFYKIKAGDFSATKSMVVK
ncbi:MAG: T9SS type A sorting domain-containing protein, partial [bacterium]